MRQTKQIKQTGKTPPKQTKQDKTEHDKIKQNNTWQKQNGT